jgi:hypothetical protein
LKLDALNITAAKPSAKAPQSGDAPSKFAPTKPGPQAVPLKPAILPGAGRRTQRVLLRIHANIHVALQGKATTFEVHTLSVNPLGALVVLQQHLPPETRLVLEHRGTKERVACKVARSPREAPEGFHTAIEFDSPAPDFWRIAFPPADWRSDD